MGRLTYASSGVDREGRAKAKQRLTPLLETRRFSRRGQILITPYNDLYSIGGGKYQVKTCDGVGTKVLLAEAANKHDTIGIDAVAMVVNDALRCGARPIALTDVIDVKKSTPELLSALAEGLAKGAEESECPFVGGETADVPELMSAAYHINCDCVGEVDKDAIIDGSKIKPGDAVIGLRSSGLHSNGISLARKALFRRWGGRHDERKERELLLEALTPTKIYVRQFFRLMEKIELLGAVHITGDAYLKFRKISKYGFHFNNFKPHPIFGKIMEAGNVELPEMFKTFNMGWGFAVIVRNENVDAALQALGEDAERIGDVVESGITIECGGSKFAIA